MAERDFQGELDEISTASFFEDDANALCDRWEADTVGVECVEPVLRFMEAHPKIDYGAPGPLTHFIERFWRKGLEARVVESVRRKPTDPTVLMLNRIINGISGEERSFYVKEMHRARLHPEADTITRAEIGRYISRIEELG